MGKRKTRTFSQKNAKEFEPKNVQDINTLEEVGLDSEDEFHEQRDMIDFEENGQASSSEGENEEVLALDGDESVEEADDDEDIDEEELERLERLARQLKPDLYNEKGSEEEEDAADESEDDEMAWGKSKKAFYDGEEVSDDEEAALEEEKEALKLQKKRAAAIAEEDFLDDGLDDSFGNRLASGGAAVTGVSDEEEESSTFDLDALKEKNLSPKELETILEKTMPEMPSFLEDLIEKAEFIEKVKQFRASRKKIKAASPEEKRAIDYIMLKYRITNLYVMNLSFYCALKTHERIHKSSVSKGHPVLDTLIDLREMLTKLETEVEGLGSEEIVGKPGLISIVNLLLGEPEEEDLSEMEDDMEDVSEGEKEESELNEDEEAEESVEESEPQTEEEETTIKPLVDPSKLEIPIAPLARIKEKKRKRVTESEFGESRDIEDVDLEDKIEGKRARKFKATRTDGSLSSSWDKKLKNLIREPKVQFDQEEEEEDFDDFEDEDTIDTGFGDVVRKEEEEEEDSDASGLEYYEQVKNEKEQKRSAREEAIRVAKEPQFEEEEEELDGEKRAATWKILKNKGLTPHRKKENRNPRVKKRIKYQTAMKRLKDFRRVAVDKATTGNYSGEKTGIKTNLARSVKL